MCASHNLCFLYFISHTVDRFAADRNFGTSSKLVSSKAAFHRNCSHVPCELYIMAMNYVLKVVSLLTWYLTCLHWQPRSETVKQQWVKAIKKMIVESIPEISHRISPKLKDLLLKGARKSGVYLFVLRWTCTRDSVVALMQETDDMFPSIRTHSEK